MGLILLERSGNQALNINPPQGDQHLSVHGSDWLWAVDAVYVISFIALFALSYIARSGEKIFHYLFSVALLVGAIAYFAMASDLAFSVIRTAEGIVQHGATRQIFFAKYINWVVAFPVVIIALGLISGIAWASIAYNVVLSWIWILSYLFAAFTVSTYKWGFYAFGTIAWLILAANTLLGGSAGARRFGLVRDYVLLAGWVNLLWLLYPIAFGLSDGGNRIGVTAGFVFFGILDVLMIPVLAFAFLVLSRKWDYGNMNIAFTQYGRVNAPAGTFPEKHVAGATPAGGPAGGPATSTPATSTPATGGPVTGEAAA